MNRQAGKNSGQNPSQNDFLFYSTVDDELYDELTQLAGEQIVYAAVWEDSMVDALPNATDVPAETQLTFDIDLYLADGVYFELYSVAAYDNPDAEPWSDRAALEERIRRVIGAGGILGEVAVDEEDALVLVLDQGGKAALYLAVGGWVLEEWDELPV